MSQKRMKGTPTRADGQVMTYREAIFAVINAAAKVLSASIDQSFEKTKYGSRRNGFFKRNYQYFEELAQSPLAETANSFGDVLKSFGLKTGQTIVAGLQAGIIDTSAVETAMQATSTEGVFGFMAFTIWSQNVGSKARYIRADIGNTLLVMTASDAWNSEDNIGTAPYVTAFISTTQGTGNEMKLTKFNVQGRNLQELVTDGNVTNSDGSRINGTWSEEGQVFTPEYPLTIPVGVSWIFRLKYKGTEIAITRVYGSSSEDGASGE